MKDFYQENLRALKERNPQLHAKLQSFEPNQKYEVFAGKDLVDINILDSQRQVTLYNDPVRDTVTAIENLDPFNRYPFLCFYGIGNGFFFGAILKHPGFRHIIVVEPELELLFIALNLSDFSEAILTDRLIIFHSEDFTEATANKLVNLPDLGLYLKLYDLHLTCPYYAFYQEDILLANQRFTKAIFQAVAVHGNDATDALVGIEHFVQNLPEMIRLAPFQQLLTKRSSDTAIIVSTGPSLTKQLPLLKEIAPYVTIVSVDASLPILEKYGIKPDIVTSLERIEPTGEFFKRTSAQFHEGVVFVHSAVQHEVVVGATHGQKIIAMRPYGYMQMFKEILPDFGYVGIGMSAANLAFEVAYLMGHKQTVFIGQDLAYGDDDTTHASDHTFGKNDTGFRNNVESNPNNILHVTGYGGHKQVKTNIVWMLFMNYFINNIHETRNKMTAINATEGGARIPGTLEVPFAEVAATLISRTQPKTPIRLVPNDTAQINKDHATMEKQLDRMIESGEAAKQKVEALFLDLAELCDRVELLKNEDRLGEVNMDEVTAMTNRIDAFKDLFDDVNFKKSFWDTVRSFIVHQEMEIAKIVSQPYDKALYPHARTIDFLLAHKYWFFSLAGGLDSQLAVMKRAKATWPSA